MVFNICCSPLRWVRDVRRLSLCSSIKTRAWSSSWTGTWWRAAMRWSSSTQWPTLPPWGSDRTTCCASWRRRDTNPSWRASSRRETDAGAGFKTRIQLQEERVSQSCLDMETTWRDSRGTWLFLLQIFKKDFFQMSKWNTNILKS